MSYYEYRVVPAPRSLPKVKGQKSPEGRYSHAMAQVLNAEGRNGWEFQHSETIEAPVKRGFLSKSRSETLSVLVFRRWVEVDATQSEHPFEPAMAPAPAPAPEEAFSTGRRPVMDAPDHDDAPAEEEPRRTGSLFAQRDDRAQIQMPPLRAPGRD